MENSSHVPIPYAKLAGLQLAYKTDYCTISAETIAISPPDPRTRELAGLAHHLGATCSAILPLLQDRDQVRTTREVRRATVTTAFGIASHTLPHEAELIEANVVNFKVVGDAFNSAGFAFISIIDILEHPGHVVPKWKRLDGTIADVTVQGMVNEMGNPYSSPASSRDLLRDRANDLLFRSAIGIHILFRTGDNKIQEILDATKGEWSLSISTFNNVPGFSYAVRRETEQPPAPLIGYSARSTNPVIMDTAYLSLVVRTTSMLAPQLRPEEHHLATYFSDYDIYVSILL